jgi:GNAT superfamily N-acetyltransferase
MSAPLVVRPAVPSDYERWLPLWDGYNAFYGRSGATALAPEITRMTWMRFFDAYEPMHALVVESGDQLVGLAHFLFHRSTTAMAPVCYLQDLFTDGSARGQGIGGALISEVYEHARQAGTSRFNGRRMRPTTPRKGFTTRSRSVPASSSTASCFEAETVIPEGI